MLASHSQTGMDSTRCVAMVPQQELHLVQREIEHFLRGFETEAIATCVNACSHGARAVLSQRLGRSKPQRITMELSVCACVSPHVSVSLLLASSLSLSLSLCLSLSFSLFSLFSLSLSVCLAVFLSPSFSSLLFSLSLSLSLFVCLSCSLRFLWLSLCLFPDWHVWRFACLPPLTLISASDLAKRRTRHAEYDDTCAIDGRYAHSLAERHNLVHATRQNESGQTCSPPGASCAALWSCGLRYVYLSKCRPSQATAGSRKKAWS